METKIQFRSAFLATIASILFACPAHSTLLRGYVKTEKAQSQIQGLHAAISGAESEQNLPVASATACGASLQLVDQAQPANATACGAGISGSFPQSFRGAWRCVSEVVDSEVDSVPVGQKVVSEIDFVNAQDGRVVAQWNQPGWSQTQACVQPFGDAEANLDRTNYYMHDAGPWWAARSSDHFRQISSGEIVAESYVDQYVDGDYKGRYRTRSILYRLTDPPSSSDLALSGK